MACLSLSPSGIYAQISEQRLRCFLKEELKNRASLRPQKNQVGERACIVWHKLSLHVRPRRQNGLYSRHVPLRVSLSPPEST